MSGGLEMLPDHRLVELRRDLMTIVAGIEGVDEVWPGPRSTELGFRRRDGVEVTLSIRAKERRV